MIIVCGRALGVAADCSETSTKSYAGLGPSGVLTWMACCLDSKKTNTIFNYLNYCVFEINGYICALILDAGTEVGYDCDRMYRRDFGNISGRNFRS